MPPPAKRGIMRNEFRQPDEQNMRQLLHQHPEDLPGLILRLAWLQGLSREEIVRGVAAYEPTGSRMRVIRLPGGRVLLDDCPMPSGSAVCRSPPSKPALPETPRTKSVQHRQGSNSMNSVCGRSFKRRTAPPRALLCG